MNFRLFCLCLPRARDFSPNHVKTWLEFRSSGPLFNYQLTTFLHTYICIVWSFPSMVCMYNLPICLSFCSTHLIFLICSNPTNLITVQITLGVCTTSVTQTDGKQRICFVEQLIHAKSSVSN